MTAVVKQSLKALFLVVTGALGSLVVGMVMYGSNVFLPSSVGFSFVSFGVSGALVFALYHIRGLSDALTAASLVSAVQLIVLTLWFPIVNAVIWSFGVNMPIVLLAFLFERKLASLRRFRFLAVGLMYGSMFVILTLIVERINGSGLLPAEVFQRNFLDGVLIGIGLGLGVEAGEVIIDSSRMTGQPVHETA